MRIILCLITFALPLFAGSIYRSRSVGYTYLFGQLTMWALFQVVAIPMIQLRASFQLLYWIYLVLTIVLCGIGLKCRLKVKFEMPEISVSLIFALLLILFQCGTYIFGMHVDNDDARWIAEANDALVKDRMLLYNPATGEYAGRFLGDTKKDAFSPWAFYLAFLSRTTGIRVATIAHTVYPPVLLVLSYLAYRGIGKQLFMEKTERGIFLCAVAVIYFFMGGNKYTQAIFALSRIWQGKATVAAVMIPAIVAVFLQIQKENRIQDWILLCITSWACCLLSSMGVAIGLVMTAFYGAYTIVFKKWNRIPYYIVSVISPIICGLGYFWLRG